MSFGGNSLGNSLVVSPHYFSLCLITLGNRHIYIYIYPLSNVYIQTNTMTMENDIFQQCKYYSSSPKLSQHFTSIEIYFIKLYGEGICPCLGKYLNLLYYYGLKGVHYSEMSGRPAWKEFAVMRLSWMWN